ncbi:MAG: hypothetical protein H6722_04145 [Sandaracinus sp.]|nr:hypothetical protein [Sandaracinus sp.]
MRTTAIGVVLGLLASGSIAYACSLVEEPQVTTWLGTSWSDQTSGTAPSNLASVTLLGEGTPIRVGALELWRVLRAPRRVRRRSCSATLDEVAPSAGRARRGAHGHRRRRGLPRLLVVRNDHAAELRGGGDGRPRGA